MTSDITTTNDKKAHAINGSTKAGMSPPPKYEPPSSMINEKGKTPEKNASGADFLNVKLEPSVGLSDMAKMLAQFAKLFTGKAVELDTEIRERQKEKERTNTIIAKQNEAIHEKNERLEKYRSQRNEAKEELAGVTEKAERYKTQRNDLRDQVETLTEQVDRLQYVHNRQLEDRQLIRRGQMCPVCDSRNHWTGSRRPFDKGHSIMAHCRAARDEAHMNFCSGNFEAEKGSG